MSVAESIVILPPMSQVGCASASAGRRRAATRRRGRGRARRRRSAPAARRPRPLLAQQLEERRVLGVDRDQARAGRLRELHHELAADDQALLVGEREVDALARARRPSGRARPSRPARSAPGRRSDSTISRIRPSGPASTSPSVQASAARAAASASASATRSTPCRLGLPDELLPAAAVRQARRPRARRSSRRPRAPACRSSRSSRG